ncbi:MAG: cardiolipin synthase [Sphingomicrobium sp.]
MNGFDLEQVYYVAEWVIRVGALVVVPFKRKFTAAAWLLLILFLPVPGLLLFLAIGEPRFPEWRTRRFQELRPFFARVSKSLASPQLKRRPAVARLAEKLGYLPPTAGNTIELIDDYDQAIRGLIADIDAAQTHVFLVVYIFAVDAVGESVVGALARAVERGVDCRMVVDPVGSARWIRPALRRLTQAGVQTRVALPFHWLRGRTRRDMRNHRKLFVIDGRIGYAGSQNIVAKDFRAGVVNRELIARCTGGIVAEMEAVFLGDWFLETGGPPPESIRVPAATGDAVLQLLPSGAEYPLEGFQTMLIWQLHQARRRAVIATPYFIPDHDVLSAMRTAALRGVEVDLVLSRVVDHPIVNFAQRSYYDDLLRAGVRIHLFNDYLLHAKNVSIDGELAILGSSNVDLRSFQLNEEVSLLLLDAASVAALEAVQRNYIENSSRLELGAWSRRGLPVMVAENLARLVSPLL